MSIRIARLTIAQPDDTKTSLVGQFIPNADGFSFRRPGGTSTYHYWPETSIEILGFRESGDDDQYGVIEFGDR